MCLFFTKQDNTYMKFKNQKVLRVYCKGFLLPLSLTMHFSFIASLCLFLQAFIDIYVYAIPFFYATNSM